MRTTPRLLHCLLAGFVLAAWGCSSDPGIFVVEQVQAAGPTRVVLAPSPAGTASIEVRNLTYRDLTTLQRLAADRLTDVLLVRVAGAGDDVPDVAGEVSLDGGVLRFVPRYPLRPGMHYRIVYRRTKLPGADAGAADVEQELAIPEPPATAATTLAHLYPTADRLPENLLKFYLHFSAPMSRGEAYRRVRLLDADGREVDTPFLELGEELWDRDLRRFTLLFDPGRIKRGLKPREDVGPVLEEGKRYTLVVDRDWLDASGRPLESETRKSFDVLPPDDTPVDTAAWQIEPPAAGSRDTLVVRFGEPMDQAMLERVVRVVDPAGQKLSGKIDITEHESCWRFTPQRPWAAGEHQLVADTTLEDLAGNSIGRAFDVDVFEPVQKRITSKTIAIPFTVAAP